MESSKRDIARINRLASVRSSKKTASGLDPVVSQQPVEIDLNEDMESA